tara:strand:+ start:121 stop:549 length:429 start_codon:yes stop_codon:yes gene_type:complete
MKTFNSKKSGVRTSDIDSSGALDIDAGTGDVTIDSASGSITLGASLTDGQTLKLGPNGATEMVFTPSGTASSEKISLTNTGGNATNSLELKTIAGGITIGVSGTLGASKQLFLTNLPTSDPSVANAIWNDKGTLKVSAGGGA